MTDKMKLTSMDIAAQRRAELKELFPSVFMETKDEKGNLVESIDFEKLKAELGTFSDIFETRRERFGFDWVGKKECIRLIQQPSIGTLNPSRDESVDFDDARHLFLEGDNLETLKLLQKPYYGKVKLIYIDPPYNTGNDFIYPDDYSETLETYLRYAGITDSEGRINTTNARREGRFHTRWLNMMYPRLFLARNLLREDGVVFISIDDNEQSNLKKLCDELFGEENFLGCAARVSKKANNQGDYWSPNFDYLLTYCKNREHCLPFIGGINEKAYKLADSDGARAGDKYQEVRLYMTSLDPMRGCANQRYYIECPDGTFVIPPGQIFPEEKVDGAKVEPQSGKDKIWRWTRDRYLADKSQLVIKRVKSSNLVDQDGKPAKWNVFTKTYLSDVVEKASAKPNSLVEEHINQLSSHELGKLEIPFPHAKPSSLIQFLCEIARVDDDDIVCDFFAGSGSTAHGVLAFNRASEKNARFIVVQLPEPCNEDSDEFKAGYSTISEIAKERIRRVIAELKAENDLLASNAGIGMKVFKLRQSNFMAWRQVSAELADDQLARQLSLHIDHVSDDATPEELLYELLLKAGFELTDKIQRLELAGLSVFSISDGGLLICLEDEVTRELIDAVAEAEPMQFICLDKAFKGNDQLKANAVQTFAARNQGREKAEQIIFRTV